MNEGVITLHDAAGGRFQATLLARRADGGWTARGPDGRTVYLPGEAIDRSDGRDVHLRVRWADLADEPRARPGEDAAESEVIPLVEEQVVVTRERHVTGSVRIDTRTEWRDEDVEAALTRETVEVQRVPVDRLVDAPVPVREEGDVTIVPLHEEVLVVEKRLLLREELHLTRRAESRNESRRVRLRREEADIRHTEADIEHDEADEA